MRERDFNRVRVDIARGLITKELSENAGFDYRSKLITEIEYYDRLPDSLRIHFPRMVKASTSWKSPRLVLEYYPYPNLSDLWVYGALAPNVWLCIFERLLEIRREFASIGDPPTGPPSRPCTSRKPRTESKKSASSSKPARLTTRTPPC